MNPLIITLLVSLAVGAASGFLGSFMVLKRMSLVGDALSHVALPGLAIAIMLHFNPMFGAFITLTLAIFGIWSLQKNTTLNTEALVGIFFTASLALGFLITPEPDLLEALFGNIQSLTSLEALLAIVFSLLIIFIAARLSKKIMLGVISEELAQSLKHNISQTNLIYLLLVGGVVALGVKFVGTLLTGALVIIPAASAKNISKNLNQYYLFSILFGSLSSILGILLSTFYHLSSGPIIVLSSIAIFLLTLIIRPQK